ncbi:elastin [Parasteatoda tepidariorum]|uniref:elastin n=1 Tax=Parasteatoda tepidariorum TaxID=114398 RepID=UPI0039BD004E
MDWQNILFVTGLLTLLTLSNAGGDHIKGGGHIKGGSETVQHPVIQEEIAPSTHNFNTKSSDAYGTKVLHTKTGDEVISPSNAKVGVITKTVLGAPPHPLQSQDAVFLSGKTSLVAPIRDPVAHPVATEQTRKTVANPLETQPAGVKVARRKIIKTIRRKPEATAQVKTIQPVQQQVPTSLSEDDVQIVLPDSKKVAPAPKPITKTVKTSTKSKINRSPLITIDGSENDAGREVIVLEDGTIVDAKDTSRLLGQTASLVPDGGIRQGSTQTINQDFKMVRGSQIPRSDIRPNFESRNPYTDFGLNIEAAAAPPVGSPELLEPIVVPGGPGGASLTLTETEIQNILLSGGIVEFPVNSQGSFPADTAGAPLAGIVRTAQTGETTRSNVQSVSQVSPARKPTLNVRPIDQKRTEFKSQTATVTSSSRGASVSGLGGSGGSVVVPGGAGGASFSLTEDEIQKILSSGGIVEFPAGTPSGVPGTGLSTAYRGGVTTMRSNAQAVSQTSSARKPTVNVRPIDLKRTEFKSQTATVTSSSRGASVSGLGGSGGSVVVPGGPGGASFSLTENEIQKILSSGGIVEFPAGTPSGVPGAGLSTAYGGGATTMRSNAQAVSQTSSARKPTVNVRPIDQKRTEFKSQTARVTSSSRGASVSSLGVRGGSVVVPGGPGGASFSLTEDEIQKILSSGGIVEFPAGTPSGVPGAGLSTAYGGGATTMRSNAQAVSQTSSARKPTVNVRPIDQKRTEFKSQTATVTSGSRGASVSSLGVRGGSVVVPGGPGGASFSLTEDEIQKILSSGGIVEFPAGTPSGVSGAGLSTAYGGGATTMRSNAQAVSQTSSARKPTVNVRPIDQKRTEFKSQTATVTSGSRGASVSSSGVRGGSVVVPGGPGGASFSLTEDEIQKILSSGGIVEFPAGTPSGVPGAGLSTAYRGGVTTMRSNAQAVSQTSSARKPTVNVRPIDLKRTEFKSQTATVTSGSRGASVSGLGVRGGSVVVPGCIIFPY